MKKHIRVGIADLILTFIHAEDGSGYTPVIKLKMFGSEEAQAVDMYEYPGSVISCYRFRDQSNFPKINVYKLYVHVHT